MANDVNLERELLGAYIESDSYAKPGVQKAIGSEKPFYELGKYYSTKYVENPLAVSGSEIEDIWEEVFGEQCKIAGKRWLRKNNAAFKDALAHGNVSLDKTLADSMANFSDIYFDSMTEFLQGFYENAGKKTYEQMTDMFSNSIEMFNGFWKMWGLSIPEKNGYADKFVGMIRTHDLAGIIKTYHEHPDKINQEYKGAKKFVAFVESKVKK